MYTCINGRDQQNIVDTSNTYHPPITLFTRCCWQSIYAHFPSAFWNQSVSKKVLNNTAVKLGDDDPLYSLSISPYQRCVNLFLSLNNFVFGCLFLGFFNTCCQLLPSWSFLLAFCLSFHCLTWMAHHPRLRNFFHWNIIPSHVTEYWKSSPFLWMLWFCTESYGCLSLFSSVCPSHTVWSVMESTWTHSKVSPPRSPNLFLIFIERLLLIFCALTPIFRSKEHSVALFTF